MTTPRIIPCYEDHLWYPILVKTQGCAYYQIVEMQGKEVNRWNDMVQQELELEFKE